MCDLSERDAVLEHFQRFDLNSDGTIHREELIEVLHELDPNAWPIARVDLLLKSADTNKSGAIELEEFVSWIFACEDGSSGLVNGDAASRLCWKAFRDSMEEVANASRPLVIDAGSASVRAGFGGDEAPQAIFESVVGTPRHPGLTDVMADYYVGSHAQDKGGILKLRYPIENAIVQDWDAFEQLLQHTIHNSLKAEPCERPIFLVEGPTVQTRDKQQRERMCQLAFETLDANRFYLGNSAVMSLYSTGRTTGLVLESGQSASHAIPIYEGYALPSSICSNITGGQDITDYMTLLLVKDGLYFDTESQRASMRYVKEHLCFVARAGETEEAERQPYELPDGRSIDVGAARWQAPELLFKPNLLLNKDCRGIHQLVSEAVVACDEEIHQDLYRNIVLSGGNTAFRGIGNRLLAELKVPNEFKAKVIEAPERKYHPWIGASICSSLSTFCEHWITKSQYEEDGPSLVHRCCF